MTNLTDIFAKFRSIKDWITDTVQVDLDRLDYILGLVKDAVGDVAVLLRKMNEKPLLVESGEVEDGDGKKAKKVHKTFTKDAIAVTPEEIQELRDLCDHFGGNASRNPKAMTVLRKGIAGMDPQLEIALFRLLQSALEMLLRRIEHK